MRLMMFQLSGFYYRILEASGLRIPIIVFGPDSFNSKPLALNSTTLNPLLNHTLNFEPYLN